MSDSRDEPDLERNELPSMISVPTSHQTSMYIFSYPSYLLRCFLCFQYLQSHLLIRFVDANQSQSFSIRRKIRLYDAQTRLPVGIYLDDDNTLRLKHVRLIYPHATTVKGFLPNQKESDLYESF